MARFKVQVMMMPPRMPARARAGRLEEQPTPPDKHEGRRFCELDNQDKPPGMQRLHLHASTGHHLS
jgi:hypothetical protein